MLIIWGEKLVEQRMGRIADFCPFCRTIAAFRMFRTSMASHVYYLTLGGGTYVCHKMVCETCNGALFKEEPPYADLSTQGNDNLDALVSLTNPEVYEQKAERLELEKKVQAHAVPAEVRDHLLAEPFRLVHPLLERRLANTNFDKESGWGCFGTVVTTIIFIILAANLSMPFSEYVGYTAAVCGGVGLIYTLYLLFTDIHRYMRRDIYPLIARCILPLEPTREEVQAVVSMLAANGFTSLRKIKVDEIFNSTVPGTFPR